MINKVIFFIAALAATVPVVTALPSVSGGQLAAKESADCAEKAVWSLHGKEPGETIYACDSVFTLVSHESKPKNVQQRSGLSVRCTDPVTYYHTQTRILATGTWWDVWKKASQCNDCTKSVKDCSQSVTWSDTITESFSAGLDQSIKDSLLGLIAGDAKFNLGYTWSHAVTTGGSQTCIAPAGGMSAIWVQSQKGWADFTTRGMTSTVGCGGNGVAYDPWSASQHSDWALKGDTTQNRGCSTNQDSGC